MHSVLKKLFLALARLLIRQGVAFKEASSMLKDAFIDAAQEELARSGGAATTTRISAVTGLNRNEVSVRKGKVPQIHSTGFVARILSAWEADRRFCMKRGSPKPLLYRGRGNPFAQLVRASASHINARTALLELVRSGHARVEGRTVYPISDVQSLNKDAVQTLDLAVRDCSTLLEAAQANLSLQRSEHVHMRTEYDNIYQSELAAIRNWMIEESRSLHKRLRALLSKSDKDLNVTQKTNSEAGARVVYGSFSWIE